MDYLEQPRVRLQRAREHIQEFCGEADAYLHTNPFGWTAVTFEENGTKFVSLRFKVHKNPPIRLGVIAGDCIHNLRAILDNIVWSLGKVFPPTDAKAKPDKLAFPVCKTLEIYKQTLCNPNYSAINSFPAAAQKLIADLQPYNAGSVPAHYLGILHELWNTDKHRSPDLMGGTNHGVALHGFNLQQPGSLSAGLAVLDGMEFARGAIPPGGIEPDARVDLSTDVAFHIRGPAKGQIARHFLSSLYVFVRDEVIAKLEPSFPKS
jgi:hypothetical protein